MWTWAFKGSTIMDGDKVWSMTTWMGTRAKEAEVLDESCVWMLTCTDSQQSSVASHQ